jgi:pimeloyl-ACP methyl ester carboxylesterase
MENSKLIQYKGRNIHYRVFGKGKPIILIHGFGEDGNIWNTLISDLQNDFLLIVPDIPGSGKSEILEEEKISIDDYAEVIKAVIDNENISRCTMIGHSMGGYITLAFAEKYSELLSGFGLFHSSAFADDEEKKQTRRKAIDFIRSNGAYEFLKTSIPNLFAGKENLEEMEQLIEEGKKISPEALIQYYEAMINRPDRTEVLKTYKKPILFVIGEKDNAIPFQSSLQQCYLPAIAHVHILDTGHMGMIEKTEESLAIVKSFIQAS